MTRSARGTSPTAAAPRSTPVLGAAGGRQFRRARGGRLPDARAGRGTGDRRAAWRRGTIRRTVAAVLAGAAVYAATTALTPDVPDPGPLVLVAALDLPVGAELTADSTRQVHVPTDLVPTGALTDGSEVHGHLTTAPLRAGEILTDLRVSPGAVLQGLGPGLVLAHLPLADVALAASLQPGVRVDVLGTVDGAVLAEDVLLAQRVAGQEGDGVLDRSTGTDALSFLVAVTPEQASRLAAATGAGLPGHGVTVVIRG